MSCRFFTADFHLGMDAILQLENRPFLNVKDMNNTFIKLCEDVSSDDIIIHVGDLACFNNDNHNEYKSNGLDIRPIDLFKNVQSTFINVRGNHDSHNKVKSLCESMTTKLGKNYPNVVIGHFPSYDPRSYDYIRDGWICICGHVHKRWRHCLDLDKHILNINVGVDAWDYKLVSEDTLCRYIRKLLQHKPDDLFRCININGKLKFQSGSIK